MLIEGVIIGYLAEALETDHVYAERPEQPPAEYYLIERTGADEVNHIQRATVAVQSISGTSLLRAAQMDQALRRAMPCIVQTEKNVSCCRLNSAYNFTDTETKEYRYQAVFDIYYMEEE